MDYLKLFMELDQQGCYSPNDADVPEQVLERGRQLKARIESYLGTTIRGGVREFQDATYHGTLGLPSANPEDEIIPWLQLSNFGNLATIWSEAKVPMETFAEVKGILEDLGYCYVPEEVAGQKYPGAEESYGVTRTWGDRFFSEQ